MITVLIAGIFGFLISLTALPVFIKKMKSLKLGQLIREEGPKGVKAQIQGDELRVSSKSRDDLQAVIALLKGPKGEELDVALQFVNYR